MCIRPVSLRHALDAGWDVVGVEPAEGVVPNGTRATRPAGRAPQFSMLQSIHLPPASFDAITLWDVLEHMSDPISFLERCASVLKRGGHLFANVPDLDSWQSRVLGSQWPLLIPEHLSYFNSGSLRMCGDRAGLQWVPSCRRPVAFSMDYIFYRLGQHQIPSILLCP